MLGAALTEEVKGQQDSKKFGLVGLKFKVQESLLKRCWGPAVGSVLIHLPHYSCWKLSENVGPLGKDLGQEHSQPHRGQTQSEYGQVA